MPLWTTKGWPFSVNAPCWIKRLIHFNAAISMWTSETLSNLNFIRPFQSSFRCNRAVIFLSNELFELR
jgi:hypothetical protein